jgi:glycine cleavage system H lipoate-binding protein
MYGTVQPELFGTKGIEYIIVVSFLLFLTAAWQLIRAPRVQTAEAGRELRDAFRGTLRDLGLPATDVFFHPGHAWARTTDGSDEVVVGWDDFARRLIGPADGFRLPAAGTRVSAGKPAWSIESGGRVLPMLAPVDGEVVEVNESVLGKPSLADRDPYGDGWLLRVRVPSSEPVRRNLLSGPLARSWAELAEQSLQGIAAQAPEAAVGAVLADGGEPRDGLARTLAPANWEEVVEQFLLVPPAHDFAEGNAAR